MAAEEKILQIIPASDWFAIYDDDNKEVADPVVCFALVEKSENGITDQDVRAMCADGNFIDYADRASNFLRIERRPNNLHDDP